ncbi:MAG: hypothetical protein QOK59_01955, partial [Nitrososphaeraceae archaeon]|nr:hypothetical protein [Nitrososphaeraceae archaeon]
QYLPSVYWYKKVKLTVLIYGMRYTKKLAATIPATMIIVIIIPFLVVLFLSSGGFLFSDKD